MQNVNLYSASSSKPLMRWKSNLLATEWLQSTIHQPLVDGWGRNKSSWVQLEWDKMFVPPACTSDSLLGLRL